MTPEKSQFMGRILAVADDVVQDKADRSDHANMARALVSSLRDVIRDLQADAVTPAQQAVLDAAEAWFDVRGTEKRFERHDVFVDAIRAMIAERGKGKP